jgi:acetate---CoA ligase (ADP-forming)
VSSEPQPEPPVDRDERSALRAMLEAETVAVVGASAREGSFGERMLLELTEGGFEGRIFPVNPRYEEILGHRCFASIAEVPGPVDLVVIGLPNAALEEQLSAAAAAGARSAVIFASGHEEPRDGVPPLTSRLAAIARDAGMALCGGNGMGFLNLERKLRACGFYEPKDLPSGGATFISHSGSAFSALLHNDRNLRFNLVVSAGQEFVTTMSDYLAYALELESTRVVGLFLETIRDPAGFREALRAANERDVPVVALKVGREGRAKELVAAHSGALAGEDGAYEALFDAYGVLRVETLDEMLDTMTLMAAGRRAGPGALASIHDSGGERAMIVDLAARAGVPFAEISDATRERLAAALEPGLPPVNPLDAWGTGNAADDIYAECIRALLADDAVAALAFSVDLTTEDDPAAGYIETARTIWTETAKPVAMLSNLASAVDRNDVLRLAEAGVPVLEGTNTGLAAFRHLFAYRDVRALPPISDVGSPAAPGVRDRWRERLADGGPLSESEGLALLSDYGVPVTASMEASSTEEVVDAATTLGRPVALKTAAPGVLHKSDAGGVVLGLADDAALRAAYEDLAARLGPRVLVQPMAPRGVEMHLGIVRDVQFGPLVLVAAGGVLVELLADRRLALAPLDEARARAMVDRLQTRRLLDGVRGAPAADVDALIGAVVAMSRLAADLGDHVDAIDANPVICGPDGCVAVDALVVPRTEA